MKHISFSALIIALISLSSLQAMEQQTTPNPTQATIITLEEGKIKMVYTDAYWDQRRAAQKEASERLVTHRQNEYNFKQLLTLEQQEPQEARWSKIEPLLASVGAYLSIDAKLRRKLFNCICDKVDATTSTVLQQNITYDTWLKLVNPRAHKARSVQEEVPPLPPLPATCLMLPEQEVLPLPPLRDLVAEESNSAIAAQEAASEAQSIAQEPLMAAESAVVQIQTDAPSEASTIATTVLKKRKKSRAQQKVSSNKKRPAAAKPKPVAIKKEPVLSKEEVTNNEFWNALFQNNVEEVKNICSSAKIDLNKSRTGQTNPPLLTCVAENLPEMAACLLDLGANPNTQTAIKLPGMKGWIKTTPLSVAIESKKIDLIEILLRYKANPDIRAEWIPSRRFEFPLNTAIAKKSKKDIDSTSRKTMAKLLLVHGVTKFFGNVVLWDTDSCTSRSLDLAKQGRYIQELMTRVEKLKITENTITIHAKK